MIKKLELLAPVGSMEALEAAVMNGADAVYLGGKLFNARHYASNFDYEQLLEAVSYAHLRGVSVFVTVNILLDDNEVPDALDYVKYLYEIGVDGIIVQDIGFAWKVRNLFIDMEVHASTQMTINNLEGAKHLQDLGFTRAVLARETPYEEILRIAQGTEMDLEVFVHGALCLSYSGQCLMSSLIGGRSGNRGTCAQPCRMEYNILDKKGNKVGGWEKGYYLSTRDLNTLDQVSKLIDAGVKSFKIEGRMKRPEYVATVVKTYRKAIDYGSESLEDQERKDVEQMFNRQFTKGLTFDDFGKNFVSIERPDNRGRTVGKIVRSEKQRIQVELFEGIQTGDGLEWDTVSGERSGTKSGVSAEKGDRIWIERLKEIAAEGSMVRKTSSATLIKKAQESYKNREMELPVSMYIEVKVGEFPRLIAKYQNHQSLAAGKSLVEKAQKSPIGEERIREQLSKLGDTVFSLDYLEMEIAEDAFMTVKDLNELRREVISDLTGKVIEGQRRTYSANYIEVKEKILEIKKQDQGEIRLAVKVTDQEQFQQLDLSKINRVYIGFERNLKENIEYLKGQNVEAYFHTEKILYKNDLDKLIEVLETNNDILDGVSASNIGTIQTLITSYGRNIQADIGLNAFNSYTVDYLRSNGIRGITLSPELNVGQIKEISKKTGGSLEAIVYGYLPAMISRNCPLAYLKGCKDDSQCSTCKYAHGYSLEDRIGKRFRVDRRSGFSEILNSVPLMLPDRLREVRKAGITDFRLDFTYEDKISDIVEIYWKALYGHASREEILGFVDEYRKTSEITTGHFFRGVLSN